MIKFNTIGQIEKDYFFEDAIVKKDVLNGDFGNVTSGTFSPGNSVKKAIMQVEVGDDAGMDEYKIPSGSHVRVVDLEALAASYPNQTIEIYGAQLPATFKVNDKLKADANGKLVVNGAETDFHFEVTKIIGNNLGVEAIIKPKTV